MTRHLPPAAGGAPIYGGEPLDPEIAKMIVAHAPGPWEVSTSPVNTSRVRPQARAGGTRMSTERDFDAELAEIPEPFNDERWDYHEATRMVTARGTGHDIASMVSKVEGPALAALPTLRALARDAIEALEQERINNASWYKAWQKAASRVHELQSELEAERARADAATWLIQKALEISEHNDESDWEAWCDDTDNFFAFYGRGGSDE